PPVTACRRSPTMRNRAAPRPTSPSDASSSRATPCCAVKRSPIMVEKRPALGRGLSALIPDAPAAPERTFDVDVDLIRPNRFQPRTAMDDERLEDLGGRNRANGVIQPIVVRRAGDGFELVAGERRWRAS